MYVNPSPLNRNRPPRRSAGFTLVELLVVVTIIAILLSVLIPAMETAVYRARLVSCAARQRAVATAVLNYANDNRTFYPPRGMEHVKPANAFKFLNPMQVKNLGDNWYIAEPLVPKYLPNANDFLQCPLVTPAELEDLGTAMVSEGTYMMMWSWQYRLPTSSGGNINTGGNSNFAETGQKFKGMFQVGDRWEWQDQKDGDRYKAYSVLIADMDLLYVASNAGQQLHESAHPDRDPHLQEQWIWDARLEFNTTWNLTRWNATGTNGRGLLDTNYTYEDGSTRQLNNVKPLLREGSEENTLDERMDTPWLEFDIAAGQRNKNATSFNKFHVPADQR